MTGVGRVVEQLNSALHHDFCPSLNRWVYWIKHPLAVLGVVGVVALLCGLFVNPYAYLLFALVLLTGVLGVAWPLVALRRLAAEAQFLSTRCRVGQQVLVRLKIRNRAPWPIWGLSVRRGFFASEHESKGIALARVGGWSDVEFEWAFVPEQRGVYPQSQPTVDTGFPFGILHANVPIQMQNELLVWPASVTLDAMPDTVELQSREDRLSDRRVGDCGDLLGTRAFRDGDSLRRVHWQQTARHGRLIVTERQAPAVCALRLVVDVSAKSHRAAGENSIQSGRSAGSPGLPSLEQLLSVAASILESMHRQHAYVELVLGQSRYCVGATERELRQALDGLARIPRTGAAAVGTSCQFDRPSRKLSTIAVTTDFALQQHQQHRHISEGERYIVIRTAGGEHAQHATAEHSAARTDLSATTALTAGCDCHAWVEIPVEVSLRESFPARWRRACHAA